MAAAQDSSGYGALAVQIGGPVPFRKHLFLKAHKTNSDNLPKERTLFVAGIPLGITEAELTHVFSHFGAVERIASHHSKTSALVLFAKEAACSKALKAAAAGLSVELAVEQPQEPVGLKSWVEAHKAKFPGNKVLQQRLDEWTEAFEAEEERIRKEREAAVDDGWTVVKRHKGRKKNEAGGMTMGGVAAAAAATAGAGSEKKKKEQLVTNFYKFQQRERRRDELIALRQQFEADKRKIAELKASRRFKPY